MCKYCRIDNNYPSTVCLHYGLKGIQIINITDALQCPYFKTYNYNKEQMEVYDMDSRVTLRKEEFAKLLPSTI